MATKKIKKAIKANNSNKVKDIIKTANNFVLETTEVVIDEAIVRGSDWQNVSEKAINGGLTLAKNQQDLMFTALETVKSSLIKGSQRFKGIFSNN